MAKDYRLSLTLKQETSGESDNIANVQEFSSDEAMHVMKTKVFTKHLTAAINAITQELCDLALGTTPNTPG